jgi:hypothetical protein
MVEYDRNPSLTSGYGFHPHGSSYPHHGTHQRLSRAFSPLLPPSAPPAMLGPDGIGQSRSASPHMSQLDLLPQSQTDAYTRSYPESEVDILESAGGTTPPNVPGFNLPSYPSVHNITSRRTVCYYVFTVPYCPTHTHTRARHLSSPQPRPPSVQAGRLLHHNRIAFYENK